MKKDIKVLTLEEIKLFIEKVRQPRFRAKQVWHWLYQGNVEKFCDMSNLPKELIAKLDENFYIGKIKLAKKRVSADGTIKYLFELEDKNLIETVLIPATGRNTVCISTQVGCKYKCSFCASGIKGFTRNLTRGEIINQPLFVLSDGIRPTHIVFMGIGEPMDNYDNVIAAIRVLNSPDALNIGARRITISTCGIIPGIKQLMKEGLQVELSISLHAANDEKRNKIMPINKKYPLKELMEACREYYKLTNRQITFEYILAKDFNSTDDDARELAQLLKGGDFKVNLIAISPVNEYNLEPLEKKQMKEFAQKLEKLGAHTTVRASRGQDIEAACGQLRHKFI